MGYPLEDSMEFMIICYMSIIPLYIYDTFVTTYFVGKKNNFKKSTLTLV